jgi:hypothetical protein
VKIDPSEFSLHAETLVAVVLGAVLATLSGFVATHVEARQRRGERQRDSALFIGELLLSLGALIDETVIRRKVGEPYGQVTIRMLRSARRELDLYERRREQLYDVRDAELRGRIHGLIVRLSISIDGIVETTEMLRLNPDQLNLREARDGAFDFLVDLRSDLPEIVDQLSKRAREPIARYSAVLIRPRDRGAAQ